MNARSYGPLSSFSSIYSFSPLWIVLQFSLLLHNVKSCSAFHSGFRCISSLGSISISDTITAPRIQFTTSTAITQENSNDYYSFGGYSSLTSRRSMFDQLSSAITEAVKSTFSGRNR